jgi:hypothetical protein
MMESNILAGILLENQRKLNERPIVSTARFERISIPLVRRVYPPLISNTTGLANPIEEKVNWKKEGF